MALNDSFLKPDVQHTLDVLSFDDSAPELRVHVMSEFMFCPRAGIIAFETDPVDSGCEFEAAPALGGLPLFELDAMEKRLEELEESIRRGQLLLCGVLATALILSMSDIGLSLIVLAGSAAIAGLGHSAWLPVLQNHRVLKRQIREARAAKPRQPNWELKVQQEINWWELLAAGFQSIELQRPHKNHSIALVGKPWRVLDRAGQRLPVLRMRLEDDSGQAVQLDPREQQRARMAAYAFLIETTERGNAEWAIVLFNNGTRGVAYPIGAPEWKAFRDGLPRAREEFRKYIEAPRHRPGPPDSRACRRCPFGEPRRVGVQQTVLDGVAILPRATRDNLNREFHCTCGDRFTDRVPPHEDAIRLGLTD